MKLTPVVRDGRQELVRLDEQEDLDDEIAAVTALFRKWERYDERIGREKKYQLLLEVDLGQWLDEHCPPGRPRLVNGRPTRPFLADLGISKYRSTQFRKMGSLGHDKVTYAISALRSDADGREITRAAVLAFYADDEDEEPEVETKIEDETPASGGVHGSARLTVVVKLFASDRESLVEMGEALRLSLAQHRFKFKGTDKTAAVEAVELYDEPKVELLEEEDDE